MKKLQLLPVGHPDARLLEWLRQALAEKFRVPAEILSPALDPAFALHAERQQFHSSEILGAVQKYICKDTWRLIAVTERDLYIPILTFVFGEAQMGGPAAVVSYHRLTQEFYRLPHDLDVLANRLLMRQYTNSDTLCTSRIARNIAAPWRHRTRWNGSRSKTAGFAKSVWRKQRRLSDGHSISSKPAWQNSHPPGQGMAAKR